MGGRSAEEVPVTYSRRSKEWVLENIDFLAPWHSTWWLEWGEEWSNDPTGCDPRSNSFALWRHFAELNSVFFTADRGSETVGMSVGVWLDDTYMPYWANDSDDWHIQPEAGDFELSLVYVEPEYRGNGMLRGLAERRIGAARSLRDREIQCAIGNAPTEFKLWVQTLDDPADKSYAYYRRREFEQIATTTLKATRRAILCSAIPASG